MWKRSLRDHGVATMIPECIAAAPCRISPERLAELDPLSFSVLLAIAGTDPTGAI